MPSSARIQIVDLTTQIGYEMLVMKLNMLDDASYSPQFMPPSAPIQLADITTHFGYESFVSKLRLLEDEQATAAIVAASIPTPSADNTTTVGKIDRAGAELRASAGVPALKDLNWQPNQVAPVVTVHEIAQAAYKRNSRNTEQVQNLLHILKTGTTPPLSRSASQTSESEVAPAKMTIHDIAQAAYKRNSLDTESVQNLLSILNTGITPNLSRSASNSSASSFETLSEEDFEDFIPMSPVESLSVCAPGCECDVGVWELSAEWECALEDGFENAAKWVDALVNDD